VGQVPQAVHNKSGLRRGQISEMMVYINIQKSNKKCSFKDCKGFIAGNGWTLCVKCRKFFHTEHDIFIQNDFELEICIFLSINKYILQI
jgi:hypothetical protein